MKATQPICCSVLFRYFPGPYDSYMEAKAAAALTAGRQAAALDKQKAHMQASIAAAEKQARQVGCQGCTGQAALIRAACCWRDS